MDEKLFDLMSKMYSEFSEFRKETNSRFDRLEVRVDRIENTVTKIEREHGQKLDALFDGWKQNTQQLEKIENEVAKHEEVIIRRIK